MTIGILALQGDYHLHVKLLNKFNVDNILIKDPKQLLEIDGLIIPGGESSVILKLLINFKFYNSIIKFILEKSQNVLNYASNSLKSKKFITNFISYGLLAHIFEFLIIYSVILAMDMPLKIHHILIFFIINHLIDTFQFTPSNIGFSELIMAAAGNQIGLDFSIGVTIKLLIRGMHLFTIVLLTALINIIYKFTKGNFKV